MQHILFVYLKQVLKQLLCKNYKVFYFTNKINTKIFYLVCDDIIRAHKVGCLHISVLHVCKEVLWIGTSAGVIINLTISQLIDSLSTNVINKLTSNSIQLKGLSFGHAGPVRFIISTDKNFISDTDETNCIQTFVTTIGDGFEDFNQEDQNLGKDDALSQLILWKL
jgi:hypothetical protein